MFRNINTMGTILINLVNCILSSLSFNCFEFTDNCMSFRLYKCKQLTQIIIYFPVIEYNTRHSKSWERVPCGNPTTNKFFICENV